MKQRRLSAVLFVFFSLIILASCSGGGGGTSGGGGGGDTTVPTAPTSLTGTVISSSQIDLSWTASTDNVGVTGYRVERCQGASCSNFGEIATPTTTSFNNTSLSALTSYSYRVRAVDAAGNLSGYSNTYSAITQAGSGTAAQAFNTSNLIELSTPQLGRDTAGTMHMLSASPVINAQGKTATRYGSCSGNCGSGAGWTFVTLDEAGAFNDDVKMAVEPGGKVHIVELLRTANTVRYATCPSNCTVAASWTSVDIDLTSNGYNTLSLPAGRALALSAAGKPRLLLTAYPGPEVLVLGCDGTCIDGSGWIVGMLTNGKASAVSLTPGEPHQAVIRLDTFSFDMVFSQCTSSCGNVVNWTTAALPAANTNFVSLVRDGSNVLHLAYLSSLAVSNDQMLYARCSGACDQAASWTTTEVLQGGAGRGGLDIALSDTGRIAIAHASVVNDTQKLSWSHCSGSCTQSASWTSTQLEAGANVSDAHPSQSGAACSSPLRFWAVGNAVQLIGSAQGGFQLSYDAASYAQCLGVQPPTSYVSGRYIRLRAQPAP